MAIDMTTSFEVVDETTIKRLYYDHPELLPTMDVDFAKDMQYNTEHFRNLLVSGILRGQSVPAMAEELQKSTLSVNYSSAIRAVRTATTSAENGGRQARYEEIARSGVDVSKQWMATGDERTRESHMAVNGESAPIDGYFSNGLKYPADPNGAASEVYNCRCTMRLIVEGVNSKSAAGYHQRSVEAFTDWLAQRGRQTKHQPKVKIPTQFFAKRTPDNYKGVWLSKREYAKVMSEIASHLTEEQSNSEVFIKRIGNYIYTIRNNGFGEYIVIKKERAKK